MHKAARRWVTTSPGGERALSTLRRFLLQVHPDHIPQEKPSEREINSKNVGILQAYLREHSYTGSASLLFHKRPKRKEDLVLETVRVVVGRGIDSCLDSMRLAIGEAPPKQIERQQYEPKRVANILGRRRRRQQNTENTNPSQQSLQSYLKSIEITTEPNTLRLRRRAAQHATARGRRLLEKYGLRFVESRCGWTPRHVAQVFTAVDDVLTARPIAADSIRGFGLVVTTIDTVGPIDADQGLVYTSPSRQLEDLRYAIDALTPKVAQHFRLRTHHLSTQQSQAEALLRLHFGRCFRLARGATTSASDFVHKCLETLEVHDDIPIHDETHNADDALVLCVERDAPRMDPRARFLDTGLLLLTLPVTLNSVRKALSVIDAADIRAVSEKKRKLQILAQRCVDSLRLRDLELYLDGNQYPIRMYNRENIYFRTSFSVPQDRPTLTVSAASRPRGAAISDLLDAMHRLLLFSSTGASSTMGLVDASLALVGKSNSTTSLALISDNELGQIILPVDFVV